MPSHLGLDHDLGDAVIVREAEDVSAGGQGEEGSDLVVGLGHLDGEIGVGEGGNGGADGGRERVIVVAATAAGGGDIGGVC